MTRKSRQSKSLEHLIRFDRMLQDAPAVAQQDFLTVARQRSKSPPLSPVASRILSRGDL
jgi:hypothetical protein